MKANGSVVTKASDNTAQLIWEGLLDSDRMCRYYGYLAGRLERLADLLQIGAVGLASGAFLALLSHFPEWVPSAAAAFSAMVGALLALKKYPAKAARCAEIYRELGRQMPEWERLWAGVNDRDEAELAAACHELATRQAAIVERAPLEVPLSRSLARRSEREADRFWAERHASA